MAFLLPLPVAWEWGLLMGACGVAAIAAGSVFRNTNNGRFHTPLIHRSPPTTPPVTHQPTAPQVPVQHTLPPVTIYKIPQPVPVQHKSAVEEDANKASTKKEEDAKKASSEKEEDEVTKDIVEEALVAAEYIENSMMGPPQKGIGQFKRQARLPKFAVPIRYNIRLKPDLNACKFAGSVAIELNIVADTSFIVLNAAELC